MTTFDGDVLFHEEQRFDRGWFWLIILTAGLPIATIFGLGLWQQLGRGVPFGNNPVSDRGLIAISFVAFAIAGRARERPEDPGRLPAAGRAERGAEARPVNPLPGAAS